VNLDNGVKQVYVNCIIINDHTMGLGIKRYTALKEKMFWIQNGLDIELQRTYRDWKGRMGLFGQSVD
jgi:hypothetical protein